MRQTITQLPWIRLGLIAALAVILTGVLSRVLQPGYDLNIWFYPAARDILQGQFSYAQIPRLNNPPWILIILSPMAVFPPAVMHGALVATTFMALYWAMRDYRRFKISYPLTIISLPMLANLWVGQLEVFTILGVMLGYRAIARHKPYWLSLGLLLMAAKPQETWIIVLLLVFGSWRQWSGRDWLKIVAPALLVAIITSAGLGVDWLARIVSGAATYAQDWENISLWHLSEWLPQVVVLLVWVLIAGLTFWALRQAHLSRSGLGLAATSSNLLSPYLTNPHLIMTLCFGWGALLDRSGRWGALAYLASLTPLLRFTSADQTWNQLDLLFPLMVWLGLLWTMWCKLPRQIDAAGQAKSYIPEG
jgi:hypothetical protein